MMSSLFKGFADKMQQVRTELAEARVTGEAGAGLVKVTSNGQREVLAIEIDPEILTPDNREMVQDLVLAATAAAQKKATEIVAEKMQTLTGGMPLPPGMDDLFS